MRRPMDCRPSLCGRVSIRALLRQEILCESNRRETMVQVADEVLCPTAPIPAVRNINTLFAKDRFFTYTHLHSRQYSAARPAPNYA